MSRKTYLRVMKNKIDFGGNFRKNDPEEQEMEKKRFVEREAAHFFGDYLYDRVVPQQHFLRQLKEAID